MFSPKHHYSFLDQLDFIPNENYPLVSDESRGVVSIPLPKYERQMRPRDSQQEISAAMEEHDVSPVTIPSSPLQAHPLQPPPSQLRSNKHGNLCLDGFTVGSIPYSVPVPWPNAMTHGPMTPDLIATLENKGLLLGGKTFSQEDGMVFDMDDSIS
ncbi:hypothetical protein BDF14DRAFT_1778616 [Spinellus fusiger]|nr:hypothetical protein BDF14DRAFT_1778616 [Spinellus fusiger]